MNSQEFFKKMDRIQEIPTLPIVALKVNDMLRDYDASIKEMSAAIENDQAMVSKILRLVNSAFYGFRSRISNIPHAVTILGFNTVRNAVVSISVIDAFSGKGSVEGFDISEFWRHSVAVAVTSRHLAEKTCSTAPAEAFVAGLLHDLGKVVLAHHFTDLFRQALESAKNTGLSFYEVENRLLPANHAKIGACLAKRWQLPGRLVDAIGYHHAVTKTVADTDMLNTVHVADVIVNSHKANPEGLPDSSWIHPDAEKSMHSALQTLPQWFPGVSEEIVSACDFFLNGEAK